MPWHKEPKKDAIGRDSRRVGANIRLSDGFRMGKPNQLYRWLTCSQVFRFIGTIKNKWGTRGTETSKYPEEKRTKVIP